MRNRITKTISQRGWMTLLALMMTITLCAQSTIKGVVIDETDTPLIGATVMVKGTSSGVVTDLDGNFTLSASKGATLSISYIGYKNQEIKIHDQKLINIKLQPDNTTLDEVIVVGYSSMKRSDLTGSVSSVSSKNVEGFKTGSVVEALGGQVAGVQITQADGSPGAGFSINVRGIGTMTGDASPLYIVDGFQVDDVSYLANSDIESIEILKDASSSAIYGARAANGVVMVTTKSGKSGRPVVAYNGSASYREISKTLDLLNPYEFAKLQMEINPTKFATTYYKPGNDDNGIPYRYQSLNDYMGVEGVDWQDKTFRPTWSQDHNLSVTGGNESTKYSISLSRYDENGIFNNSGFEKTTGKFNINQKLTKKITLNAIVNYANTNKQGLGTSGDTGRFNMLAQILSARPTGGLALTNEELLASAIDPLELESGESLAQVNPIIQTESVTNTKRAEMWSANMSLTYEIIKGLTLKTAGNYNTTNIRTNIFYKNGSKEAYRNGQKPYGQTQMGRDLRWSNSNTLTWKRKTKKHDYSIMLGQESSYKSTEYVMGQAKDFPFDNLGNNNLGIGATPSRVNSWYSDQLLLSCFAQGTYNYNNRYLLTATIRADGSTVFADKNKWGYFPSFAAAWRVSEEAFMKDITAVSNFKVRLGWGTVGNDRIANYLSLDLYEQSKYGVGSTTMTVLTPKQIKNQNLKWEGSTTVNLGVDLGLLDNRLNLTADFFIKNTKDLLLAQSLAHVTGFSSQYQNIGKIQNKGIELSLNSINIQSRNFTWQTDFNISFIRNTLKALQSGVESMYSRSGFHSDFTDNDYMATVGSSLGLIYGYEFDGVYQSTDFNTTPDGRLQLKEGVTNNLRYGSAVVPGVVKYKDQNGDGVVTTEDRTVIGNAIPKWFGGITNTFSYRGIDLSVMLQFNYGNDIYNATRLYSTQTQNERMNQLVEVADRWTPTNASNSVPSAKGYVKNELYSRFIEDGSFLRLKNITLGYTVPGQWTRKAAISKLRVYASAQNLFCLTGYSGYDPEVSTSGNNPMTPGMDWGAYPKSKVITFGLDIQF